MKCPRCDASQTGPEAAGKRRVKNMRHPDDETVRRRRECWACGFRWSTLEVIATPDDGLRELEGQKYLQL